MVFFYGSPSKTLIISNFPPSILFWTYFNLSFNFITKWISSTSPIIINLQGSIFSLQNLTQYSSLKCFFSWLPDDTSVQFSFFYQTCLHSSVSFPCSFWSPWTLWCVLRSVLSLSPWIACLFYTTLLWCSCLGSSLQNVRKNGTYLLRLLSVLGLCKVLRKVSGILKSLYKC